MVGTMALMLVWNLVDLRDEMLVVQLAAHSAVQSARWKVLKMVLKLV